MTRTTPIAVLLALVVALAACSPAASEETATAEPETAGAVAAVTVPATPAPTTVPPTTVAPTASSEAPPTSSAPAVETVGDVDVTRGVSFTDGLDLDVFAPRAPGPWPVVVFFHGGSWYGGAKENVQAFARSLAEAGFVVFNATYRTGQQGGGFPHSYADVGCAIATANSTAATYGGDPDQVYVAGHSAGAHLASTVLLAGDTFASEDCATDGPIAADGFVGLAGPYDVTQFALLLTPWFGGTILEIPEVFEAGSPYGYLDADPLGVLLVHGTADELVPTAFTTEFAAALSGNAWDVETVIVEGATHGGIIDPLLDADATIAAVSGFVAEG